MATFAKSSFSAASYAAFRPSYPPTVYTSILSYHRGPKNLLLDLGCGHGLISRYFAPHFTHVLGTDPSPPMVTQAISSTPSSISNISFSQASAENLSFIEDGTLDMVVSGQAAHWFDYSKVWGEISRKLRSGGTLAFWGYKDNVLPDYPKATEILDHYCYGPTEDTMGPYWEQPGRNILRNLYRDIVPPEGEFEDVKRIMYEPATKGKGTGEGEVLMSARMTLGDFDKYWKTASAYHNWQKAHPEEKSREEGGKGDVMDRMWDKMLEVVPELRGKEGGDWRDTEVETEWGSVIMMARKK